MKIRIFLLVVLILGVSIAKAQHSVPVSVQVKGQVIDSLTSETIPFATIKVMDSNKPSVLAKAVAADENGNFSFSLNKQGNYILQAEYIGKKTLVQNLEIGTTKTIDLGKLLLADDSKALSEVVITAQKPLVKVDLDKITYSMEDDPESKTNNVLDMLRKVPMVTVDGEDKIQLKGSSNYKIYLNGKPSNMISSNPTDVLKSMPANTIKDIEVITDPGAKYDAEGVAGIINIITQKNTSMGGYTATINSRVDNRGGFGLGGYLSMKVGKIGFTGNYNYYKWRMPQADYKSYTEFFDAGMDDGKYFTQNGASKSNGNGQYGSGELSYEIDTLNLINIGYNRYEGSSRTRSDWFNQMLDSRRDLLYNYRQQGKSKNVYGGTDVNADYQRTFKKKDQLLTASYRFSYSPSDSNADVEIKDGEGELPATAVTNSQYTDADMKEHTFQTDFVTPFGKVHNVEAGVKYIIRLNQSNSGYDFLGASGWETLPKGSSSEFEHRQDILAAYGGYSAKFKKWGIKTGLRYEATWLNAEFPLSAEQNFKTDYSNLVPSATVTYQLKPAQNIRLGYNMRISRPGIGQLNPYVNSSNPNFIVVGNPELDAVKTHSLNVNYGYFSRKLNLNMNMSYNFSNNGIEDITTSEGGVNTTTYGNIGERKNVQLSAYVNWSATDKLRIYSNLSGGYVDIQTNKDAALPQNKGSLSNNGFSGNMYAGVQYSLPKSFRISANGGVFSPYISLENKGSSFTFHTLSLSKGFLNDKLTIQAHARNPFMGKRDFKNERHAWNLYSENTNTQRMRAFGISISFRFGEMKAQIKKTKRSINNDDAMSSGQQSGQGGVQGGGQGQ
ncbi:TonB-dependent receptor [Dysgonomonas sp. 511]|uniref:TonB-dependent receptor domain-containing protein n=1 Tax=Dysgonomonas sp. 511 TaxID=2302930 RepID=UPI0013D6EFBE|nr:TonB-dependent receptor [Dysgonomonas sp. 511]NDV77605.1 TonB-dependent receptor [Dysgonomonas sp. 511]